MDIDGFVQSIGPSQALYALAIIGIPLIFYLGQRLVARSGSIMRSRSRASREDAQAVPADRIARAAQGGGAGRPEPWPVTKAHQDMAFEMVMGAIGSLPTDATMEHPTRQAILFRQSFPPPHDRRRLSFFGGAPVAPPTFVWPAAPSDEKRFLHFLMQIDCADVPPAARLDALPDRGVLYFFVDLAWGSYDGFRVLYEDAIAEDWTEPRVPAGLVPAFGADARYVWGWMPETEDRAGRCPNVLPKWPFQPMAINLPPPMWAEPDEDDAALWWPGEKSIEDALLEAQGAEVVLRSFPSPAEDGSIQRPFSSYPHDWRAVTICAGLMLNRLRRESGLPGSRALASMPADQRDALLERMREEARRWFDRAEAQPAFAETLDTDREAFWAWLAGHAWLVRFILPDAATLSVEASLAASPQAAARIPSDAAACVHSRHALALRTETGVFAARPDRMLAPPTDVQNNQWEIARTHLLLLELSSNEGLGHHFGEGVYQFWITPDDLRARRFDKVVLTADAY